MKAQSKDQQANRLLRRDIDGDQLDVFGYPRCEKSACGVGLIVSLKGEASHALLIEGLYALSAMEHRGACAADGLTGDGAGIMTDIPFELLGYAPGTVAVASIFVTPEPEAQAQLLHCFEETFAFWDMPVLAYREVPTDKSVLGEQARASQPRIVQALLQRPVYANTDTAFNQMLYLALRKTFTRQRRLFRDPAFYVASLSVNTLVYKGLTRAESLSAFYPDLQRADYRTRFVIMHRRFSTNTVTSWDKAQPFRLLAHNGEINTLGGNRSWAYSREKTLSLPRNELLTHEGISDSGSLNEMAEALMYRSSLPNVEDALALLIPPYDMRNPFYKFWSRAMEPWDGPALVAFSDGAIVGARLDRNGFRPCRWAQTRERFYLASEAGIFALPAEALVARGALGAGRTVMIELDDGRLDFGDPSEARHHANAIFDARLYQLGYIPPQQQPLSKEQLFLFQLTREGLEKMLRPMIETGREPIGSMGDTARLAILSDQPRPFFDYFLQNFAQVTNPPLDYLRERMVTDLSVYLGPKPNIINQKELIPPPVGIELPSPVLSLGQLDYLRRLDSDQLLAGVFAITFRRDLGALDFRHRLEQLALDVVEAVRHHCSVVILSDRDADWEHLPMPLLIVLRRVIMALDKAGLRLRASLVVDSGQIQTTHQLAAAIGFGASAVCPWLPLQIALAETDQMPVQEPGHEQESGQRSDFSLTQAETRERNLLKAFEGGLLKVMSKAGISVVRSYQSAKLFTILGLDREFSHLYFRGVPSLIGGLTLEDLIARQLAQTEAAHAASLSGELQHSYLLREHNKHARGEKHAMTALRSKLLHRALADPAAPESELGWRAYLASLAAEAPFHLRHLLCLQPAGEPLEPAAVEPLTDILRRFGAGAMSFGAISARSQRDLIVAMDRIGARSNSGEGGENPFYAGEGISASIKQVASGRFGVSARYLIPAREIQIKVAQGAKPGEGGQLMAPKVNGEIAAARHSLTGVDLISPPPLHDIYSIEDLKELIYTLRQVNPSARISVKLVSGAAIGTIAVGVAKAGADIIQVSGADGGTGAATLSSMKHTGLPFEPGLAEVHQALLDNGLRERITLRVDGGLHSAEDVLLAAALGADEFDFGKLLLVAQGCVMARVCEKNTCPAGIATQDPRFQARYGGSPEAVVRLLELIGQDIRSRLGELGLSSLEQLTGRRDLLKIAPEQRARVSELRLDLSCLLQPPQPAPATAHSLPAEGPNPLNRRLLADCGPAIAAQADFSAEYAIRSTDRAIGATLAGALASRAHLAHLAELAPPTDLATGAQAAYKGILSLSFSGSAGQGFAAFACEGMHLRLAGEANDSVAKSLSGGLVVVKPPSQAKLSAEHDVIIGNCALYGATGGRLYVRGMAGDRFAVRNSGAISVAEGAGLHACEYMTRGLVVLLGPVGQNLGSGMTGGSVYLLDARDELINPEYLRACPLDQAASEELQTLIADYARETASPLATALLEDWPVSRQRFSRFLPLKLAQLLEASDQQA